MIITFDLPLWIKATRIVLETEMPIVVRIEGFHTHKSFLGCIGYIMADSGLEELKKLETSRIYRMADLTIKR